MTITQYIAQLRDSDRYLIHWDEKLLGWVLSYHGQTLACVCAYLPGRPAIDRNAAQQWADDLVGPQAWTQLGNSAAHTS